MRYIECPDERPLSGGERGLFLAGGITDCPDWQSRMVDELSATRWTLLNPRRKSFAIDDPVAAEFQIRWEHARLREASDILFWFPQEAICPIALYELGAWSMTAKPLFVGVHPLYPRRRDVEIQTALARPDVRIVYSLDELARIVKSHADTTGR
ncbi:MAG: nucleoside 2-deoxyribosyltransferase domain-containing protein [Acidobacteriota bacterium]